MSEQLANNASSTLVTSINDTENDIVLADVSKFPTDVSFRILIGSEILYVYNIAGSTLSVSRGYENTTASSHASGAVVTHVLTAESLAQYVTDRLGSIPTPPTISSGVIASLPTFVAVGDIYFVTDGILYYHRASGGWLTFGPIWPLDLPPSSGWSFVNQGSTSVSFNSGRGLLFTGPSNGGSNNQRMYVRSVPSSPYTITMGFIPLLRPGVNAYCGVVLYNSSTGGFQSASLNYDANMYIETWNSVTSFNSTLNSAGSAVMYGGPVVWIQIKDDGTNRIISVSKDRQNWMLLDTRSRTFFMTPDKVGIIINPRDNTNSMLLVHYKEE